MVPHWEEALPYFTPTLNSNSIVLTSFRALLKPKHTEEPKNSIFFSHEHATKAKSAAEILEFIPRHKAKASEAQPTTKASRTVTFIVS